MNPWEKTENFDGDVKVYYDNLLNHFKKFKNELFVESGTFLGNGLKCALDAGFEKCFTIEIHPHLYEKAQSRFENEIKEGRVISYLGDSEKLLPSIGFSDKSVSNSLLNTKLVFSVSLETFNTKDLNETSPGQ